MGVSQLLSIGNNALNAHQVAINVTGNNIANVNTEGYCRQNVRYEEYVPVTFRPGQIGMGAHAAEITRQFNRFIEDSFLSRYADQNRWEEQRLVLTSAESLFNESNRIGISSAMGIFFQDWQLLSLRPDDMPTREALLADANNLARMIRDTQNSLDRIQREMDSYIRQSVDRANELMKGIAEVNLQISTSEKNPNSLYDKRDLLVRELATLIDVDVIDRGKGEFHVLTKHGELLVQGNTTFELGFLGPRVEKKLTQSSAYTGELMFNGSDSHEYTLEIVRGGNVTDSPPPAFRVSLDGGKTWLRNDDGTELHVDIEGSNRTAPDTLSMRVKELEITFTSDENFCVGDKFEIIPKTGLYWISPTRPPLNITPQVRNDGTDNPDRLTGGKLTAYFSVRDYNVGRYKDKMNALANSLIWETNYLHSQGAGMKNFTVTIGSYTVDPRKTDQALGLSDTGLAYYDRLKQGNVNFTLFDANGEPVGTQALNFGGADGRFDPAVHTLEDVADAINANIFSTGDRITASIVGGKLILNAPAGPPNLSFGISSDTCGLMAALGINTFFVGSDAHSIAMKDDIMQDVAYINAASINADGKRYPGDNKTALSLAMLAEKTVKFSTMWEHSDQSFVSYHASVVTLVGADVRSAKFNAEYNKTLADELDERISAISGVNLDEEMTSLIKFQHSYTAAAKLISTADQMLQTILGLKQ
jgi:flagellar hook-associated protein 1 FlgK